MSNGRGWVSFSRMFRIADEWLVNLTEVRIQLINLATGAALSGDCSQADINALNDTDKDSVTCEVDQTSATPVFLIKTKLSSGLELKPRRIELKEDGSLTLKSLVVDLVQQNNALAVDLSSSQQELQLTRNSLETIVNEQVKYRDIVIKRVALMLKERNFWIEKYKAMKDEPKEG